MGTHACLERGRTHFGQKRLPRSDQTCQKPGFPPPHAKPLHLALLEFFMDERTRAYATAWVLEPDLEEAGGEGESVEGEWGGKRRKKSRFGIQVEGRREGRTGPIGGGRAGEGEDAEE